MYGRKNRTRGSPSNRTVAFCFQTDNGVFFFMQLTRNKTNNNILFLNSNRFNRPVRNITLTYGFIFSGVALWNFAFLVCFYFFFLTNNTIVAAVPIGRESGVEKKKKMKIKIAHVYLVTIVFKCEFSSTVRGVLENTNDLQKQHTFFDRYLFLNCS